MSKLTNDHRAQCYNAQMGTYKCSKFVMDTMIRHWSGSLGINECDLLSRNFAKAVEFQYKMMQCQVEYLEHYLPKMDRKTLARANKSLGQLREFTGLIEHLGVVA